MRDVRNLAREVMEETDKKEPGIFSLLGELGKWEKDQA